MGEVLPFRASRARFHVGQLVHHRLFDYRGVIIDVDPTFRYHVLVHGATHQTYVAERNLEADPAPTPVVHPMVGHFFSDFDGQAYRVRGTRN
jgi:heat shock protein HspQ